MTPTMLVRELTAEKRAALRRGLKSADGFTLRRSQVLLASAGGTGPAATIGESVGRLVFAAIPPGQGGLGRHQFAAERFDPAGPRGHAYPPP